MRSQRNTGLQQHHRQNTGLHSSVLPRGQRRGRGVHRCRQLNESTDRRESSVECLFENRQYENAIANRNDQHHNRSRSQHLPSFCNRHSDMSKTQHIPMAQSLQPASSSSLEIDGFYFDPVRQRYFRVLPDHLAANSYTPDQLAYRQHEDECQAQRKGVNRPKWYATPCRPIDSQHFLPNAIFCRNAKPAFERTFSRVLEEKRVVNAPLEPTTSFNFSDDDLDLEQCQYLAASPDGKNLLGCWSTKQSPWGTRIMCSSVHQDAKKANEHCYGLAVRQSDNFICTVDRNVVDICQAKMDSSVTCILYITMPNREPGSHVFLQPLPEMSNICDQEFLKSPIYNAHWAVHEGALSCAWDPKYMRVSLGLERCGLIKDVVAEKDFRLYSRTKSVLTQRFSKDGNLLFMGLRSNDVICCDLRLKLHHTIFSLPQKSTCWMNVMQDSNYLLAANFHGEIKLWDLRKRDVVRRFDGLRNSHSRTPVILNEDETVAFAVSQDGTTRGWSLQNGNVLCVIPAPRQTTGSTGTFSVKNIPKLCYSNRWAGGYGNCALALGLGPEIHFYELTVN